MWTNWLIYVLSLIHLTRSGHVFQLANKDMQITYTDVLSLRVENLEECIEKCRDDNTCVGIETSEDSGRCKIVKSDQNKTSEIYRPVDTAYNIEIWVRLMKECNEPATPHEVPELWMDKVTTSETSTEVDCSDWTGFVQTGVGCYMLVTGPGTWDEAQSGCEVLGSLIGTNVRLAEIDSLEEMQTLVQLMDEASMFYAWVGARDVNRDDIIMFITSGNQVPGQLWARSDQPNHWNGDCVFLHLMAMHLVVDECNTPWYGYICEVFP